MRIAIFIILFLASSRMVAQKAAPVTDSFQVEGAVKTTRSFALAQLSAFAAIGVDSVVITNHLRQKKHTLQNVKGVLLKDVLAQVGIDEGNVKMLSEYFITCIANDGYKVVFSWNELFNSETGRHVIIITGANGKSGSEMSDRIALISPSDDATGRRFVKGLQKIIIQRTTSE